MKWLQMHLIRVNSRTNWSMTRFYFSLLLPLYYVSFSEKQAWNCLKLKPSLFRSFFVLVMQAWDVHSETFCYCLCVLNDSIVCVNRGNNAKRPERYIKGSLCYSVHRLLYKLLICYKCNLKAHTADRPQTP